MTRYYSLFRKVNGRWERLTEMGFPKRLAHRIFADPVATQSWWGEDRKIHRYRHVQIRPI